MKNIFFNAFLLIFFFTYSNISFSQERIISGYVSTLENIVVVNAEVKVLSNNVTVLTDSVGNFIVNCLPNDKIKISANGFYSQKIKVHKKTKELLINLKFKPREKDLDLAIGYGHIKEKDKSHAISAIRNDDKYNFSKYSNMYELIDNSSTSVMVVNQEIFIRGSSSLKGSNAALILLNGQEIDASQLLDISPLNVKSVDILTDSSTAIYGLRGANGVVSITTKRGEK